MGLVSFLVSANEMVGTSGVVSPAAASARVSRREMLFPEADDRPESALQTQFDRSSSLVSLSSRLSSLLDGLSTSSFISTLVTLGSYFCRFMLLPVSFMCFSFQNLTSLNMSPH
jgi:hypothetical protein